MTLRPHRQMVLGLFAAVGLFGTGYAQQESSSSPETRIEELELDIWPEYDDPRVLVIYSGQLAAGVELPRPFSLVIPRGAEIHMAGAIGERGEHLHAAFETRPAGDSLVEVSYQLEASKFYMEFYYDPFRDGDRREFRYPLVPSYRTERVVMRVQQPLRASAFRITPVAVDVLRDANGFGYHRLFFDELAADEERSVTVSYSKPDREPSVAPQAGAADPAGGRAMRNILIVGTVLLIGAVGMGVVVGRRSAPALAGGRNAVGKHGGLAAGGNRFCRSCGTPVKQSDNFCGECGAKA